MHGNNAESCFVKRVNTHEGCWYHSQQDHNPSLMLSNHMKWREVAPSPPDSLYRNNIGRCTAINLNLVLPKESIPVKDVGFHSRQDPSASLMLSNQMKWQDVTPSPPDSLFGNDIGRCLALNLNIVLSRESIPMKDVGTTVNKTMIPV
jgi:hypothetical protein